MEGYGKYNTEVGYSFVGGWKNGELDGNITVYEQDGKILFQGNAAEFMQIGKFCYDIFHEELRI